MKTTSPRKLNTHRSNGNGTCHVLSLVVCGALLVAATNLVARVTHAEQEGTLLVQAQKTTNQSPVLLQLVGTRDERIFLRFIPSSEAVTPGSKEVHFAWLPRDKVEVLWIAYPDGLTMPWEHSSKDSAFWSALRTDLDKQLRIAFGPSDPPDASTQEPAAHAASSKPRISVSRGPIPFTVQVKANSEAVQIVEEAASILYTVAPSEITAIAAVIGETLTQMDTLGGGRGVSLHLTPTGQSCVLPNNSLGAVHSIKNAVLTPSERGRLITHATKTLNPAKQLIVKLPSEVKNCLPTILEPEKRLERWVTDPDKALDNTRKDIGKGLRAIGGLFR